MAERARKSTAAPVQRELVLKRTCALDEKGKPLFEVLTKATFADRGGKTELTLRARVVRETAAAAPHLAGMEEGWNQTLDRLVEEVETSTCSRKSS